MNSKSIVFEKALVEGKRNKFWKKGVDFDADFKIFNITSFYNKKFVGNIPGGDHLESFYPLGNTPFLLHQNTILNYV